MYSPSDIPRAERMFNSQLIYLLCGTHAGSHAIHSQPRKPFKTFRYADEYFVSREHGVDHNGTIHSYKYLIEILDDSANVIAEEYRYLDADQFIIAHPFDMNIKLLVKLKSLLSY